MIASLIFATALACTAPAPNPLLAVGTTLSFSHTSGKEALQHYSSLLNFLQYEKGVFIEFYQMKRQERHAIVKVNDVFVKIQLIEKGNTPEVVYTVHATNPSTSQ